MLSKAVLICTMLQLGASPGIANRASTHVHKYSARYNINPILVIAIMMHETRLRHFRNPNRTHDYGIMQVHCPKPSYAYWCSNIKRLKRLRYNIKVGIYILSLWKRKYARTEPNYKWVRRYNWYNKTYARKIRALMNRVRKLANDCKETRAPNSRLRAIHSL